MLETPEFLRCYDSVLRHLADRGHIVAVAVNSLGSRQARLDLIHDDRIHIAGVVPSRKGLWKSFLWNLRATIDFVHYLDPRFGDTPMLRHRMYRKVLPLLRPLGWIRSMPAWRVRRFVRILQAFERAVPVSVRATRFLTAQRPDVVFVSPLVYPASDQDDTARAASAAGIPVIAGIASWDNLTSKGRLRVNPDAVMVWNRHQQREAVELHGVDAARVLVTGAQAFDHWFERQPSMPRREFCRVVGLPEERPLILFAASSRVDGQSKRSKWEAPFVREWLKVLRASDDPMLHDAAVLLRPHPFKAEAWSTTDFSDLGPIAIWPRGQYTPAAEEARASLFDSVFHCQAVVGINTTVMVEAAILRRPVLSVLLPAFEDMQDGTQHFRYLRLENGGFLRLARSMDEHLAQLGAVLRDPRSIGQETEEFVRSFLRPHGVNTACTPLVADAIERVARRGCVFPQRRGPGARALCAIVWPLAVAMWLAKVSRRSWRVASAPATNEAGLLVSRGVFGTARRLVGEAWRQAGPRTILNGLRHARYRVSTVIPPRRAKDNRDD